jgi:SAM-dependent methyltransferase
MLLVVQIRCEIHELVSFISLIGEVPDENFGVEFYQRLDRLEQQSHKVPENRNALMKELFTLADEHLKKSMLCHHCRTKPFGYAGDHIMVDMIYERRADSPGKGKLLDDFFQRQPSSDAVRNRKQFFIETYTDLCRQKKAPSVLNIACGPCRDVAGAVTEAGSSADNSRFHCIDMDSNAISYAQSVTAGLNPRVTIHWEIANAFRMKTAQKYDLVWSAGLFDYLDERAAVLLLKKMWSWTNEGGELIVGNFHVSNPVRPCMEWCVDWKLIHRSEEDMLRLFDKTGIRSTPRIHFEKLGVNMFLRARKG